MKDDTFFPAALPGLDLAAGLNRIGGDRKSYLKLLAKFSKNQGGTAAGIASALTNGEVATARILAHTLAGVSGNIGADRLSLAARGLEASLNEGNRDEWRTRLDEVTSSLLEVLASVTSIMPNDAPGDESRGDETAYDADRIAALLGLLKNAIDESNAKSMAYYSSLKEALPGGRFSAALDAVGERLDEYDFERAADRLRELTAKFGLFRAEP